MQSGPTPIEETKVEEAKLEETKEAQPAGTSKETHVDTSRPEPNRKKKSLVAEANMSDSFMISLAGKTVI